MTKNIICVACPMGCELRVDLSGAGEIESVAGNTCKRGVGYAETEIKNPARGFHSTVRVEGGAEQLVSVKSAKPVPKRLLMDCARAVRDVRAKAPVAIGDVIVPDVCGTGIDLIATNRVKCNS